MDVQVVIVNHATTSYVDLLLRSLLVHHTDRSDLAILVLDNSSPDIEKLGWSREFGVEIARSGYTTWSRVNTHGEILRDAVMSRPDCDAYLFADSDTCVVTNRTIDTMANELAANPDLFALRAAWLAVDGETSELADPDTSFATIWIEESRRPMERSSLPPPLSFQAQFADRVSPAFTLVRNSAVFRACTEYVGLSAGHTECLRGARYFDTFGLLTQVMKTHGLSWTVASKGVIHFGAVSWNPDGARRYAKHRDQLLERYSAITVR